jgi:hypothetical protein
MKTNFSVINALLVVILLTTHTCGLSMFSPSCYKDSDGNWKSLPTFPVDNGFNDFNSLPRFNFNGQQNINVDQLNSFLQFKHDTKTDRKKSLIAAAHNRNNALLSLPKEHFNMIIANSIDTTKPLKEIIKPALLLSTTCKAFNAAFKTGELLMIIGNACKSYTLKEKNNAMQMLLQSMNDINYWNKQHAALLLTYAGAENNAYRDSLLQKAVHHQDKQMLTTLFNNNANPNQQDSDIEEPIFFQAKKIDIIQIFIDQPKFNLHEQKESTPNVLWACLTYHRSPKLIKFLIEQNVNVKQKDYNNNNLLHELHSSYGYLYNLNESLEIATLFINKAPKIINELNNDKQTPLDLIQQTMKQFKEKSKDYKICQALIELFKKHDGKTAQQLKLEQYKIIEQPEAKETEIYYHCCICLDSFKNLETIMNIPCPNTHTDKICINCYDKSLKFSENCPLCRGTLI